MKFAINFTHFGPYHRARLAALGNRAQSRGDELLAYEMAGSERKYPWETAGEAASYRHTTLFPDQILEDLSATRCGAALVEALEADQPDAVFVCGYSRPESMAAVRWAERRSVPAILMSETQEIDHPRTWWKEAIKGRRVRRFAAALVGGPRHRDYLAKLGMPALRIALGYNAVDNDRHASRARSAMPHHHYRDGGPIRPYFLAVNRLVPEKNLVTLIEAFAEYRSSASESEAWDLVLCGDGPDAARVDAAIRRNGLEHAIHRPGFLQEDGLARWYGNASGFVHPSRMEPWGLVANEAAACGLPLLISDRCGCVETLVPEPSGTTGRRFNPSDIGAIAASLAWLAGLSSEERQRVGSRARDTVAEWGPERFASGAYQALELGLQTMSRSQTKVGSFAR